MKYSKLKHEIELLQLQQKHELEVTKLKHEKELNELYSKCTHKYEDGSTALKGYGNQFDWQEKCEICGKLI